MYSPVEKFWKRSAEPSPSTFTSGAFLMMTPSADCPIMERLLAEIGVFTVSPKSYVPFGRNMRSPSCADLMASSRLDTSPDEIT